MNKLLFFSFSVGAAIFLSGCATDLSPEPTSEGMAAKSPDPMIHAQQQPQTRPGLGY